MLGKLLKYEIKATGRIFLPLYAGLFAVAVISGFALGGTVEILNIIIGLVLFALYAALIVVTILLLIQRFYQNLLKDEGYLMFTLPVSPAGLILSKLITTCMWFIVSIVVGAVSGAVAVRGVVDVGEMVRVLTELVVSGLSVVFPNLSGLVSVVVLFAAAILSQLVFNVLHVYVSLAIGQLPPFGRYKILFSVVAYIVITAVTSTVATIAAGLAGKYFYNTYFSASGALVGGSVSLSSEGITGSLGPAGIIGGADAVGIIGGSDGPIQIFMPDHLTPIINQALLCATALNLAFAAAAFIGTALILQKKLNLD